MFDETLHTTAWHHHVRQHPQRQRLMADVGVIWCDAHPSEDATHIASNGNIKAEDLEVSGKNIYFYLFLISWRALPNLSGGCKRTSCWHQLSREKTGVINQPTISTAPRNHDDPKRGLQKHVKVPAVVVKPWCETLKTHHFSSPKRAIPQKEGSLGFQPNSSFLPRNKTFFPRNLCGMWWIGLCLEHVYTFVAWGRRLYNSTSDPCICPM